MIYRDGRSMLPIPRSAWTVAVAILLLACDVGTGVEDDGACRQARGFGIDGCVEVRGSVLDEDGRPLAFSWVAADLHGDLESGIWAVGSVRPDSAGRFALRATRVMGPRTPADPDTVSFHVRASMTAISRSVPPCPRDSVRVTVAVAPVGEVPTPAEVELRLPRQAADACRGY
jgi:hypothetical protein